jgi:hypothetical protein
MSRDISKRIKGQHETRKETPKGAEGRRPSMAKVQPTLQSRV